MIALILCMVLVSHPEKGAAAHTSEAGWLLCPETIFFTIQNVDFAEVAALHSSRSMLARSCCVNKSHANNNWILGFGSDWDSRYADRTLYTKKKSNPERYLKMHYFGNEAFALSQVFPRIPGGTRSSYAPSIDWNNFPVDLFVRCLSLSLYVCMFMFGLLLFVFTRWGGGNGRTLCVFVGTHNPYWVRLIST